MVSTVLAATHVTVDAVKWTACVWIKDVISQKSIITLFVFVKD
jgi:hypothetical protein